ncbi:integrase [Rhizobium azooxidifex]|uniref:Integrase n=1 Tax=Mycoplana azooxidifex TaxID=1636188 RepID=A0A7W6DBZ5_9HYPH|nr:tyrosine-type recombinase/integrase [Mycoplana azooxidifex]MBB3976139.1 integrase [Mycoplana azooxidifex]
MARQPRYLLNRNGRYFARLVVPKNLRPFLDNKTELREALGPDRRKALARLHSAVANLQSRISIAEQEAKAAKGEPITSGRYLLSVEQLAVRHYKERLAEDDVRRNQSLLWWNVGINDLYVAELRAGVAGKLSDVALQELFGDRIERYSSIGNTVVVYGTEEWRAVARAMCISELEVLARLAERDEGDFVGKPVHPMIANAEVPVEEEAPVLIRELFDRYMNELRANGKGEGAEKRWRPIIEDVIKFTKTTDARKLSKKMLVEWKDAKLATLSPRTVRDVYLTAINAVLNWAVSNDLITINPAKEVKLKVAAKILNRPKGFTREEAIVVLDISLGYVPAHSDNSQTREKPGTSAAKKWAPLICAFTGSRISEITQLRKEDVREENGISYIRITPDAGKVKNRQYRDIPLHNQIIEKGFLDFVSAAPDGPLFYPPMKGARKADPAQTVSGRISNWLQREGVVPDGVSPNHGWRHAFKTTGLEVGIDGRVLDAIQGHAARTAGENYGDVTIAAKRRAIDKFPPYPV